MENENCKTCHGSSSGIKLSFSSALSGVNSPLAKHLNFIKMFRSFSNLYRIDNQHSLRQNKIIVSEKKYSDVEQDYTQSFSLL